MTENVSQASLINQVQPEYPPLARQARIQGTVRLQVVIGRDGTVQQAEVISGHPLLVASSLEAVRQWEYQPTLLNGEPVEVLTIVDIVFTLNGQDPPPEPPAPGQTEDPVRRAMEKYPGLGEEITQLLGKLYYEVQVPAPRTESRLLPRLPSSTLAYAAFPNYGSAAEQTLEIFRQARQESPALAAAWRDAEKEGTGPKFEIYLRRFIQIHQYLGEEIVVSAAMDGRRPRLLVVAEIRKPGLKALLQQLLDETAGKSKPALRILDVEDLAATQDAKQNQATPGEFLVLVRSDFAVVADDMSTLESFNARLDAGSLEFGSTPFGQRGLQEFSDGLTISVAADLRGLLNQLPPAEREHPVFQSTGFADLEYFVWGHKKVEGQTVSQAELSFTAPRHGIASWLAKPGPMGSLDFVSPQTVVAASALLKQPARIFDDIMDIAALDNANPFRELEQIEQALQLSLRADLLSHLGGELTLELVDFTLPRPNWKAIFAIKNVEPFQQTLNTLLAAAPLQVAHAEEDGVTYHTIQIPDSQAPMEIGYSLVDGYLVVGSGREVVADAVRLHRSGGSLGKSQRFLAGLPPGESQEASGLLYMNQAAISALQMRRLSPELADTLLDSSEELPAAVSCVYGEEAALRQATTSLSMDTGIVLVVAAIAIPNLLRARITANETSAVGSLRSVVTAQVQYAVTYPERGFAADLATLGPSGDDPPTADRADLLDGLLAGPHCTGEAWCQKSGYRFRVTGVCQQQPCEEFLVVATPITPGTTGTRSFCSTADGVIRSTTETPAALPVTVDECRAWPPLN